MSPESVVARSSFPLNPRVALFVIATDASYRDSFVIVEHAIAIIQRQAHQVKEASQKPFPPLLNWYHFVDYLGQFLVSHASKNYVG